MNARVILTHEERQLMRDMRADGKGHHAIADRIGVAVTVIRREMRAAGLPMRLSSPWSPDDEAKLLAVKWPIPAVALLEMFPGRTKPAILKKCWTLGIKVQTTARATSYSKAETAIVRRHFGTTIVRQWAHLLPGRTVNGIINHARFLCLKSGLQHASVRTVAPPPPG